jgi:hypothetical protein
MTIKMIKKLKEILYITLLIKLNAKHMLNKFSLESINYIKIHLNINIQKNILFLNT